MSRKREEKKYHPLDLQKNIGVGIPLPLGGTPIFANTFTTEEQALSNLKNLLLTRKVRDRFNHYLELMSHLSCLKI